MSNEFTIKLSDDFSMGYVSFASGKIAQTIALTDSINLDIDADGRVLGLELIELDAPLPQERLIDEFHIDARLVEILSKGLPA